MSGADYSRTCEGCEHIVAEPWTKDAFAYRCFAPGKCDNIREVHDPRKGRDGDYCIPCIERMDSRRPSPIHADEKERVLRCECFTPIPEDEEGENEKV